MTDILGRQTDSYDNNALAKHNGQWRVFKQLNSFALGLELVRKAEYTVPVFMGNFVIL